MDDEVILGSTSCGEPLERIRRARPIACPALVLADIEQRSSHVRVRFRWGEAQLVLELASDVAFYFWEDQEGLPFWASPHDRRPS